jgi:predicted AlkP superfamily pyrophosphatase or phosphodiesterase
MKSPIHKIAFVLVALSSAICLHAQGPGRLNEFNGKRVLFIGVDGTRADAVIAAMERGLAPQMKGLSEEAGGLLSLKAYAGGELDTPTQQPTISGPGWTSLLTGVWIDKHRISDNRFLGGRYQAYPHFMRRIKEVEPSAFCASFVDWPPIHDQIADSSRVNGREFLDIKMTFTPDASRHFVDIPEKDIEVRDSALAAIRTKNPDVMFVYFGQVDEIGHGAVDPKSRGAFTPDSALYLNGISHVDSHIGELLRAVRARPSYQEEDWLILITTDHGGRGNGHGGNTEAERNIWLVAHGKDLPRERLMAQPLGQIGLVSMIYKHLGITPKPEWNPPAGDTAPAPSSPAK